MNFNNTSTGEEYYVPENVLAVLKTRYHIIMPILVAMTFFTNSITLSIARKMNSKKNLHVNTYIKLMSITEICYAITLIPTLIDTEFCIYNSYIFAFYQTFFVQPIPYYFRYISNSLLLNLSFDRFMVIWFPHRFKTLKRFTNIRLLFIWILVTLSIIPHFLLGKVQLDEKETKWISIRGYKNIDNPWLKPYKLYIIISFVIIPSILIIFLSIGMIIGICEKIFKSRIKNSIMNYTEQKKRQKSYTLAVLASNIFYVGCMIPFAFLVGTYKLENGRCFSNSNQETIKSIAFCFLMAWVILNQLLFFIIHRDYQKPLKEFFCNIKP